MKPSAAPPATIDAYIAAAPIDVQPILERIRQTVRKAAPRAEERISYRMPAFFLDGVILYFAAFKKHIGVFPPVRDAALRLQLAKYAGPKGNLQFPLSEPVPYALITKIVKARVREMRASGKVK
ncbi:MAG: DUF1801 domain-containing protein [Gemmatimonadaceae bacterium]